MNEKLIVPPAAPAVSLDAMRRAARTSGSALDIELQEKVEGITSDAEHATHRAFITQTWELTEDAFPTAIKLRHPPIVSVLYVKYYDVDGVLRTMHPDDYTVDTKSEPGWIVPAPGRAWPATAAQINAVEVRYVCGYGPDHNSVPAGIKQYIIGMLENEYFPNSNVDSLSRKLDRATVYG